MFTITTRTTPLLSRQDIWFYDNQPIKLKGNNLFYHAFSLPKDKNIVELNTVYTTSIDLNQSLDEIKGNFKKKLRGYINKGSRTEFKHKIMDISKSNIQNNILQDYDVFAKIKGLESIDRTWFISCCKSKHMMATQIFFENKPLITHVYLKDNERTRLQFSFHLSSVNEYNGQFQSLANRYLHWLDIIYFKENGFKIYDFGGIPVKSMASLREFKLSFGGIVEEQYSFIVPNGFYALVYKLKQLVKSNKKVN
jgi:hypothetical protein